MNNQQTDRIINFYRINHQFHEPYQFLIDGNFIRLLVEKELDLKRKFEQSIKGKCTLRVTSCIIRELELLGDHFRLVLEQARTLKVVSCKHSIGHPVDACIQEMVGDSN